MVVATLLVALQLNAPASPPVEIRGTVVDAAGGPVAGATIAVGAAPPATSGPDGRFRAPATATPVTVAVRAPGFVPVDLVIEDPRDELRVVLAPAGYAETVVVTASRVAGRPADPAAPVSVLTAAELSLFPPAPIDDALRRVPGFSLFRRSSSRTANPTTQGAALRGLSASGASRALVLADGVPLNDPFGGWVYWNRVPAAAVERVEVVRGSAGDLYGADAAAGVIQVLTATPGPTRARVVLDGGSRDTARASLFAAGERRAWSGTLTGEASRTDGAFVVAEDDRGAVDTLAGSDYGVAAIGLGYRTGEWRLTVSGEVFEERRDNGTVVQTNSTSLRQVRFSAAGRALGGGLRLRAQAGEQVYRQAFSAIGAGRASETLTLRQQVPASQHGLGIEWHRAAGQYDVVVGADARDVAATNVERGYFADGSLRAVTGTSGFERSSGLWGQAGVQLGARVRAVAGLRADLWQTRRDLTDSGRGMASPRFSLSWSTAPWLTLRGGAGWAFRPPTLNELYRGFRVGNVQTLPNADLRPERVRTIEGGALAALRRGSVRATLFHTRLEDAIANVTLTTTPSLVTRRRENTGIVASTGLEVESEWRASRRLALTGMAAWTRSRFGEGSDLTGNRVPQVPRWQAGVGARWQAPAEVTLAGDLRAVGAQFEDDLNSLVLKRAAVVDLTVTRPAWRRMSVALSVENLFDVEVDVGRTPVRTIGLPRTVQVGVRFFLP